MLHPEGISAIVLSVIGYTSPPSPIWKHSPLLLRGPHLTFPLCAGCSCPSPRCRCFSVLSGSPFLYFLTGLSHCPFQEPKSSPLALSFPAWQGVSQTSPCPELNSSFPLHTCSTSWITYLRGCVTIHPASDTIDLVSFLTPPLPIKCCEFSHLNKCLWNFDYFSLPPWPLY